MRRKDENFCAQHILQVKDSVGGRKRIPCPLDKGHTVWEDQVENHLTKCQAKKVRPSESWYSENCNVSPSMDESQDDTKDQPIDYPEWIRALESIMSDLGELARPVREVKSHKGLETRLLEVENHKHAIQQSSLVGHLESAGLLGLDHVMCEFGCGRAELSRYVARSRYNLEATPEGNHQKFLFIDRASQRLKMDSKLAKDYNEAKLQDPASVAQSQGEPETLRIKIDIKDLALKEVPLVRSSPITVISKHLCGCATDLTLSCIAHAVPEVSCDGMVIALCCRHACNYEMYNDVGKEWLYNYGIDKTGFKALTKMAPWAVCGPGRPPQNANSVHASGLSIEQREQVGLMARRAIDHGRVLYLQSLGYDVRIVEYIDRESTLENHCLIANKRS